jgi:hypothetical protein
MTTLNEKKRRTLNEMLTTGRNVYIHLDPRGSDVLVPERFTKQDTLVLEIGLNMKIAMPDLNWDDRGIGGSLSFNRKPFFCFIPWSALKAAIHPGDAMGYNWSNLTTQAAEGHTISRPKDPPAIKTRGHLRLVVDNG